MANVPFYKIDEQQAKDAYAAYQGLLHHQSLCPELVQNDYWRALKETAFARFRAAFEAL